MSPPRASSVQQPVTASGTGNLPTLRIEQSRNEVEPVLKTLWTDGHAASLGLVNLMHLSLRRAGCSPKGLNLKLACYTLTCLQADRDARKPDIYSRLQTRENARKHPSAGLIYYRAVLLLFLVVLS